MPSLPGGYWVEPTLFISEDNSLQICREEIFGPVAVLIPFDTDDEAIAIANDSRYGRGRRVDQRLGRVHRYRRSKSGNVWVNTYLQTRYELPFGGIKESGYGHDDIMRVLTAGEVDRDRRLPGRVRRERPRGRTSSA